MSQPPAVRNGIQLLAILTCVNLLNYFDRMLMVVVAPSVRAEFSLSDSELAILTGGTFVAVYAMTNLIAGWLADRHGHRRVIAVSVALWSVMTIVCGLARSFVGLAAARGAVGIGEGGSTPPSLALISEAYTDHRRPFAIAIFLAGGMVGLLLSFLVGSAVEQRFGWRSVFFVGGIPGIFLCIWIILRLPAGAPSTVGAAAPWSVVRRLSANRAYRAICLASAFGSFATMGMIVWLPLFFMRNHALSMAEIAVYFGPAAAVGMLVGLLGGGAIASRAGRLGPHRLPLLAAAANLITIPLYLLVLWVPSTAIAMGLTMAAMLAGVLAVPALQAAIQSVCEPALRASAAAVASCVAAIIGQAILPLAVGMMSDAFALSAPEESLRYALTISVSFLLVAIIMALAAARAMRDTLLPGQEHMADAGLPASVDAPGL